MSNKIPFLKQIEQLQKEFSKKNPPVHLWNPPLSGDMDMRIATDGRWFHEGDPIQRQPLVNLFASILKKEADEYFLVTPVEKWRIQVDCAPFVVTSMQVIEVSKSKNQELTPTTFPEKNNQQHSIAFTTNTDETVIADSDHSLWVESSGVKANKLSNEEGDDSKQSEDVLPFVRVRDNLDALIHRNVYYELVELALSNEECSEEDVFVFSAGQRFSLLPVS